MILSKLGRKGKGKKYFLLPSQDEYGYTITCSNHQRLYVLNNVSSIEWLHGGKEVFIESKHHKCDKDSHDLSGWDLVEITEAKQIATHLLYITKK